MAAALIEGGADIEVPDGSIGTPLDNAVGYACWSVARVLVASGARVDKLWHAGALGLLDRLEELLDTTNPSDRACESLPTSSSTTTVSRALHRGHRLGHL